MLAEGLVWVADDVGELIGFAAAQAYFDALHLWELAVRHDRQGRGAGRALVEAAATEARRLGLPAVTLTTFRDIPWNGPLYARLGFRLTEYAEEDGPNGRIAAAWMHRKGNVHDFAITNGKGPRLHHFAYWVPTAMNILHLCDVMASSGYLKNIERGPGRHGISNAFFLYVRDPDGHRLELYTSDYFTMDHDHEPMRWSLRDPRRQTLWGAPAPRSWFEQGSPFAGQPIREPLFVADVTVAD